MFDDFDTQINCEEFYTAEESCELEPDSNCIGCGTCNLSDIDEELGTLEDATK